MKKKILIFILIGVVAITLAICLYFALQPKIYRAERIDPRTLHASPANREMLIGLWRNDKNVYYRFRADGTGCTWDTDDDVNEEEASIFNWEAYDEVVMITHRMIFRGFVPFYYEIDCLNAFDLRFHDGYSAYVFERVEVGIE